MEREEESPFIFHLFQRDESLARNHPSVSPLPQPNPMGFCIQESWSKMNERDHQLSPPFRG